MALRFPATQIGSHSTNHWTYDATTGVIDLSRPHRPGRSGKPLTLQTTTKPIRIDAASTALLIIDMQNYFLSPTLRLGLPYADCSARSPGLAAADTLLATGIPAARKLGIQICWVNWGLTDAEIEAMPPGMMRAFGVYDAVEPVSGAGNSGPAVPAADGSQNATPKRKKDPALYKGLGVDLGLIDLGGGHVVDGGRVLVRGSWNAALYEPLDEEFRRGRQAAAGSRPDVWIHKNRMSGLWGARTELEGFLEREGIRTLLFAGVNTDQCVGSTLTDAFSKGYDCILLRDGAATGSPVFAQQAWEWNCANIWGFVADCFALRDAEEAMER